MKNVRLLCQKTNDMKLKNYLTAEFKSEKELHNGVGVVKNVTLFDSGDFTTVSGFLNACIIPPGSTIGLHQHGNDEELYFILEGTGKMTVDGEQRRVGPGDVIFNKPHGTHGLENDSTTGLRILVFGVAGKKARE